jgi:hypothetical protein
VFWEGAGGLRLLFSVCDQQPLSTWEATPIEDTPVFEVQNEAGLQTLTWDVVFAETLSTPGLDSSSQMHVGLARWLVAALGYQPDLVPDYRVVGRTDHGVLRVTAASGAP